MNDIDANQIQEINQGLEFANFLQDPSAAKGVLESIQSKYPNVLGLFMHNTSEHLMTLQETLSAKEIDQTFNYMVNNFILIMHTLDMCNGGEMPDMEDMPDESTPKACDFGRHTMIGQCEHEGTIATKIMGEEITLCEDCAKEVITNLIGYAEEDAIVKGLTVLPVGAIIQAITQEMDPLDQSKCYLGVLRGELPEN